VSYLLLGTEAAKESGVTQDKRNSEPISVISVGEIGLDPEALWQAADKLRGSVDAGEYKHVVLGLIFLKYISDAFEARRARLADELKADGIEGEKAQSLIESRDEYTAESIFWVPPEARWSSIQNHGKEPNIAKLIDDAMYAIERDNPKLKGKLPRDYARRGIAPERLGGLIDQIASIAIGTDQARAKDVLGRVYEYFLGKFAAAEGKLGGEFFTPRSVVRLLVEMIEPYEGRVYDPCCGSGGMFVQSEGFVQAHGGHQRNISIFGQESNPTTWRLAHMNLAIRGIEANLGEQPADSFVRDLHPDLKADYILANPPFNISDWSGDLLRDDVRWTFGVPPTGNANYAWIQHFIHHLAPPNGRGGGIAGFVMANGSLSSETGNEGIIRKKIIDADLVDCIVAMPPQLFLTTGIPVCLWLVSRDKSGKKRQNGGRDRRGQTLFIDARLLGQMETRTLRVLSGVNGFPAPPDSDIGRIVRTYHAWRGEAHAGKYEDMPGFCKSATRDDIKQQDDVLSPGRYIGPAAPREEGEPFEEKMKRLTSTLRVQLEESRLLDSTIRANLETLGYDN
jgi:type I restriction enzyme M protein